jgi:predicted small lipoprotein YifL
MRSLATRHLLFLTLLSALAGCTAPAPFVLPGIDSRADATGAQSVPPAAALPRYRYGYHPYGAYYGAYGYGTGSSSDRPRDVPADPPGTPGATPGPIAVEPPPPPRPREVEATTREARRTPTKAAENPRPVPRQPER